jgi:D-3-phosphoglycerate dehydrogenase
MKNKVLITDDIHPLLKNGLENAGFECIDMPIISDAEVRERIADYTGLIINSKIFVDKDMLDKATRLKFVGRVGSGMEIVDKVYAAQKGVAVLSSPEGNRNAVAEHALGMLLSLANNLNRSNTEVKRFEWRREANRGFELRGLTIGIVGFGHTGSSFSAKLLGLGMRVLTYDKYLPKGYLKFHISNSKFHDFSYPRFSTEGVGATKESYDFKEYDALNYELSSYEEIDYQQLIHESNIISFHLPLTVETQHLANTDFFNQCKKDIIVINTSRGNVVKTEDLIEALSSGKVRGACLDVFENEKTATYTEGERVLYERLFSFDNVIVSPHIAGWTHESKERLARILLRKILAVISQN